MIVKRKFFFAWQEDKELEFLNKMSEEGLQLSGYKLFTYTFDEREEKNYYQFDFRFLDKISEEEYLQLYEDAGMNYVCRYGGWYFFSSSEKKAKLIYNDNASLRDRYKRILFFLLLTGFPLYYQVLVIYPNLSFMSTLYTIARVIMTILMPIHLFALIKIFSLYKKTFNNISE